MKQSDYTRFHVYEERRERLIELMDEHQLTCRQIGQWLDREPQTVRAWRSGNCPITDHTLALLEIIVATRSAA